MTNPIDDRIPVRVLGPRFFRQEGKKGLSSLTLFGKQLEKTPPPLHVEFEEDVVQEEDGPFRRRKSAFRVVGVGPSPR